MHVGHWCMGKPEDIRPAACSRCPPRLPPWQVAKTRVRVAEMKSGLQLMHALHRGESSPRPGFCFSQRLPPLPVCLPQDCQPNTATQPPCSPSPPPPAPGRLRRRQGPRPGPVRWPGCRLLPQGPRRHALRGGGGAQVKPVFLSKGALWGHWKGAEGALGVATSIAFGSTFPCNRAATAAPPPRRSSPRIRTSAAASRSTRGGEPCSVLFAGTPLPADC